MQEENESKPNKIRRNSLDSSIGEVHFHSKPTTVLTEESSLASLGDDLSPPAQQTTQNTKSTLPDYENFPVADKMAKLKRSKSFNAHLDKPARFVEFEHMSSSNNGHLEKPSR